MYNVDSNVRVIKSYNHRGKNSVINRGDKNSIKRGPNLRNMHWNIINTARPYHASAFINKSQLK